MKTRIGIVGIGGVGGYFGGLLAAKYKESDNIEIIFITRPNSENIIREEGLKIITPKAEQDVYPDLVTSEANSIGLLDVLIIAVKSYDLIDSVTSIKLSLDENTIILPLLNGVDAKSIVQKIFPNNLVLDGCVFVISKVLAPGIIQRIAGEGILFFGSNIEDKRLNELHHVFLEAGINAKYSSNILEIVWGKFLFISSLASLTSYLDITTGQIFENETNKNLLIKLLNEFTAVAKENSINLSESIVASTLAKIESLPYETTTSMQRDYQQNKKTEYKSLTKYIVDLSLQLNVKVPTFEMILSELEQKE